MIHALYVPQKLKIQYIANIRMPTEKAHGVQIMKTCEAFTRAGSIVELVVPNRKTDIAEDPFSYYAVDNSFAIKRVPVMDLIWLGRVGFWLESVSFALFAVAYVLRHRAAVYYSRDEFPLWLLSYFVSTVVWESHTGRENFFTRRFMRAGRKCVVISHGLKEWYQTKKAGAAILVAPDAVDLRSFTHPESQEAARQRLGLPADKKIALYIGQLDGWKGVSTLLEASKLFSAEDPLVAIIGGEKAGLQKLAATYPKVLLLGPRPYTELADNQAAADVLVLPNTGTDPVSVHFTSPMKLFSYMTSGRPIVASDLPSLKEVLTAESAAFFTPDDPQSLAEAVRSMCSNPDRAARLAARAKTDVLGYSWDARARSILDFIA